MGKSSPLLWLAVSGGPARACRSGSCLVWSSDGVTGWKGAVGELGVGDRLRFGTELPKVGPRSVNKALCF